jgi:hypothetical protein
MTKAELAKVERRRRVLQASLDISRFIEQTRRNRRLSVRDVFEIVQELAGVYLKALLRLRGVK